MTSENIKNITEITAELHDKEDRSKLGTCVLYTSKQISNQIYALTAKHCLKRNDTNRTVSLRVYCPSNQTYQYITPRKQKTIIHPTVDVGIIIFSKKELFSINPQLPTFHIFDWKGDFTVALTKGFPVANLIQTSETGESTLATLNLSYLQETPNETGFQLSTENDYDESSIQGMSGGGIFIEACEELYLNGIFTRFSGTERGKVVYGEHISSFNELLRFEYFKEMPKSFLGHHKLGYKTFENNVKQAIAGLGPRYSTKVNVETGIGEIFECIGKTQKYYERVILTIDSWLTEKSYNTRNDSTRISKYETDLNDLRSDFTRTLSKLNRNVLAKLDFVEYIDKIDAYQKKVEAEIKIINEERLKCIKIRNENKDLNRDEERLIEISNNISTFRRAYRGLRIDLANSPYLIIKGEAGCGKSHLMGDIALKRIETGLPTLLFLGTDFTNNTYEEAIINKIGFNGTFQEFLSSYNQIGQQADSRSLIMIDALNEGPFAKLWKSNLSELIKALENYPAIALVVTVRDTYYKDVIPDSIISSLNDMVITHTGFKGLEYEAVKEFCIAYNLNLPNIPILTPEFCNPLFLKIVCETMHWKKMINFPKGFNGATQIFGEYFKILDEQFEQKRDEYKYRNVVTGSIKCLALPIFNSKHKQLKKDEADLILQEKFKYCPYLLADLIDNNVVLITDSAEDKDSKCIEFCYQRMGDYIIADILLKKYSDWESFKKVLSTDKNIVKIFISWDWHNQGIIEALSICIPEKYGHEISEIIPQIQIDKSTWQFDLFIENVSHAMLNSISWRSIKSIKVTSIVDFLRSKFCKINSYDWYEKLVEVSIVPEHPFNADYFHEHLIKLTMAVRDSEFQFFFNQSASEYTEPNNINSPLRHLIDWAWTTDISRKIDDTTARLAAKMLCWLLCSTYIRHRDEATKALVNLLYNKVDTLIETMRSFEKVDDMYISERIYAVAYGVALRTPSITDLKKLATYVYETIFKDDVPPKNILLRDSARNIIEYALYKDSTLRFEIKKIRPPYKSELPKWPTEDEIQKFHIDLNSPIEKSRDRIAQNFIWNSIKGGIANFWEKIALPTIEDFYPISIKEEDNYYRAEQSIDAELIKVIRLYVEISARKARAKKFSRPGVDTADKLLFPGLTEMTKDLVSAEEYNSIENIMIPFKVKELELKSNHFIKFPSEGVRNWMVKRSYELGFDVKIHGEYDNFAKDWTFRNYNNRIDRIGKKYQWIAFHEIMGILADNYKLKNDYANNGMGEYEIFQGTWQSFLRNINPSILLKENMIPVHNQWWSDEYNDHRQYKSWRPEEWTSLLKDLPDPIELIQKIDNNGEEWLALCHSTSWDEPKQIGEQEYERNSEKHDLFLSANAIILKKEDISQAQEELRNRNLWDGIEFSDNSWHSLTNREKFWSPAYKDIYRNNQNWANDIKGLNVPFMYSFEDSCARIENDQSKTIKNFPIPCQIIFEGMGLKYHFIDGQLSDKNGDIIVLSFGPSDILIKKKPFIKFLRHHKLDILWIVRGEKRVYHCGGMGCISKHDPCGIYVLDEDENPAGELKMYKSL